MPASTPVDLPRPGHYLRLDFNLAAPVGSPDGHPRGRAIDVLKNVGLNGRDVGKATVRISGGSSIYIARSELRNLLATAGLTDVAEKLAAGQGQGFVSFDEIRRQGLDVRYDPIADRLVVSSG